MIDQHHGNVGYNDWRTFNASCSQLGFYPTTTTTSRSEQSKQEPREENDFQRYLNQYG